jgi:hypothetical protein
VLKNIGPRYRAGTAMDGGSPVFAGVKNGIKTAAIAAAKK